MSTGLNSLILNIKPSQEKAQLKRGNTLQHTYLKQNSLGADPEERKITLEGWSQSNESFLFGNVDEQKQDAVDINDQKFQKNYSKVCKNALNNLSESLALMHKKNQLELLMENLQKAQIDSKTKSAIDKDKSERSELEIATQAKQNQTLQPSPFEAHDGRQKQEQKQKTELETLHDVPAQADPKGMSIEMERINDSIAMVRSNENFRKAQTFYKSSIKTQRTPRSEVFGQSTQREQNSNVSPLTASKLAVQVIHFKTKTSSTKISILDRFKIFSNQVPKSTSQTKMKSARTASLNLDEKDLEKAGFKQASYSPTSKLVPYSETSPAKKATIKQPNFSNSMEIGTEMKIRGFGLLDSSPSPTRKAPEQQGKTTLKKIFGTKNGSVYHDDRNPKNGKIKRRGSIYNILEAFKMQPTGKLQDLLYEGYLPIDKNKSARGKSMTNDPSEEKKDAKVKRLHDYRAFKKTHQNHSKQEGSLSGAENLDGMIQSIFDLRQKAHPVQGSETNQKKNGTKDLTLVGKQDSGFFLTQMKDLGFSKVPSKGSTTRLIVTNHPLKRENSQIRSYTHREREL